jgi:hypothetical protein
MTLSAPEVFEADGLAALALGVVLAGVPLGEVFEPLLVDPVFIAVEPVGAAVDPVEVITTPDPDPDPEAPL